MGRCSDARGRLMGAVRALIWEHSYGSTTVDAICGRAGVQKGSFYHFFDSKADLAIAALRENRAENRRLMDALFSPLTPPLDRLRAYARHLHDSQAQLKRAHGHVLGCPLFTLGAEVSTEEPKVRAAVAALLGDTVRYFESAIREAQAAGDLPTGDAAMRARCLHAFLAGALTQARIANNPALLRDLPAQATAWLRLPLPAGRK